MEWKLDEGPLPSPQALDGAEKTERTQGFVCDSKLVHCDLPCVMVK